MTHDMKLALALRTDDAASKRKLASFFRDAERAAGAASKATWAAGQGKKLWEYAKSSGPGTRTVGGAVVGGVLGNKLSKDEETVDWDGNIKKKSKLPGTIAGAAAGAALGAGSHPKVRKAVVEKVQSMRKTSGVALLRAEMDKQAALGAFLGSMAAKAAPFINKVGPTVGRALTAVKGSSTGRRALIGAGAGAALNVGRNFMKPKQERGSMLGAATRGAAVGGLAGLASKELAGHALSTQPVQDAMHGRYGAPKA